MFQWSEVPFPKIWQLKNVTGATSSCCNISWMVWNVVRIIAVQFNVNCSFRCFYQDVLERRLWAMAMSIQSMVSEFNPCPQNMTALQNNSWPPGGREGEEERLWPEANKPLTLTLWRWRKGRRKAMTRLWWSTSQGCQHMEVERRKKDDGDKTDGLSDQVVNTRVFIKIKMGLTSSSAWSSLCMWWVWNYLDPILNSLRLSGVAWWADAFFCPSSFSAPLMFEHICHYLGHA